MAKELPYFKFEPNQWENGNIQILSREDKGLFIDLCSVYWSRLGDVPFKLAVNKLCGGNATALKSLCDENIIEVIDDNIYIKFLSEQLQEFDNVSAQNSKNAKEGWEKRRKQKALSENDATALNPQSESDAIRGEERREEKKKENNNIYSAEFLEYSFDDFWSMYPNKVNKKKAMEKFAKLKPNDKKIIEHHLPIFINNPPFKEYKYPHAVTYLNQERFKDEIQLSDINLKSITNERFNQFTDAVREKYPDA